MSMRRPGLLLLALLCAFGVWLILSQGETPQFAPRPVATQETQTTSTGPLVDEAGALASIRIATLDLERFGTEESRQPQLVEQLARLCQRFQVIALQGISSPEAYILPTLIDRINQEGPRYDFVIGPRAGRGEFPSQLAVVYDRTRLEVDRQRIYSVADPDDLLSEEPLVVWCRCRGPDPRVAYTFSLVNVRVDPQEIERELRVLKQVHRAVQGDGRGEDDVLLLGDFRVPTSAVLEHLDAAVFRAVVMESPGGTNPEHRAADNLVFPVAATTEFTGRAGAIDFLREYNLSRAEAGRLADHFPIWGEFSVFEGGARGRVAIDDRLNPGGLSSIEPHPGQPLISEPPRNAVRSLDLRR